MKIFLVDDGFEIKVRKGNSNKVPVGADVYEAPKGISLWEGVTCIMQDCSDVEVILRLREELPSYVVVDARDNLVRNLLHMAKKTGSCKLKNRQEPDAPFRIVISD